MARRHLLMLLVLAPTWGASFMLIKVGMRVGLAPSTLLYYGLLAGRGASYSILVTYLVPAIALGYGVLLLGEPLTIAAVAGLALVLLGVALGTGTLRLRRQRIAATETPA